MSICNKCGGSGPFYPYRPRVCIECERARVRAYYEVNRERVQTTNRSYRKANLEQVRALDRRIARERNGSLERVAQRAAWIARNPEKARAQAILHKAVERKKILKPTTCSKCGAEGRIEAHHPDYSKPLEVIWLCRIHHVEAHRTSYNFSCQEKNDEHSENAS